VRLEKINTVIGSSLSQAVFGWKQILVAHPSAIPVIKLFVFDNPALRVAGNGDK
jgi:hypothetical protein